MKLTRSQRRQIIEAERDSFSKMITRWITCTYFIGVAIGGAVVIMDPSQLSGYLQFIGGITGVTIAFYVWKAKAENMKKLGWEEDKLKDDNAHASQYPGDGPGQTHNPTF